MNVSYIFLLFFLRLQRLLPFLNFSLQLCLCKFGWLEVAVWSVFGRQHCHLPDKLLTPIRCLECGARNSGLATNKIEVNSTAKYHRRQHVEIAVLLTWVMMWLMSRRRRDQKEQHRDMVGCSPCCCSALEFRSRNSLFFPFHPQTVFRGRTHLSKKSLLV